MIRPILRTITGLAMLWGAWNLNRHADTVIKETISPPPPLTSIELPPDPMDLIEQPVAKAKLQQAESLSMVSLFIAGGGGLLTLSGLLPLGLWALFGKPETAIPTSDAPQAELPASPASKGGAA